MNLKIKGIGGPSPGRVLKEATSMELHNSKLNNEVDGWKNKAKQYQVKIFCYQLFFSLLTLNLFKVDYEKLLLNSEQSEKELKITQQKLENTEKQLKMVRLTKDNLNSGMFFSSNPEFKF